MQYYFLCEIALPKNNNVTIFEPDREYEFEELSNDYNQENESSFKRKVSSNIRFFGNCLLAMTGSVPARPHGRASVNSQKRSSEIMCKSVEQRSAESCGKATGFSIGKFNHSAYKEESFITSFILYRAEGGNKLDRSPLLPSSKRSFFERGDTRIFYDFNHIVLRATSEQAQAIIKGSKIENIDGIIKTQGDMYQVDFDQADVVENLMLKPDNTESESFILCFKSQALAERTARQVTRNLNKELLSQESNLMSLGNRM